MQRSCSPARVLKLEIFAAHHCFHVRGYHSLEEAAVVLVVSLELILHEARLSLLGGSFRGSRQVRGWALPLERQAGVTVVLSELVWK